MISHRKDVKSLVRQICPSPEKLPLELGPIGYRWIQEVTKDLNALIGAKWNNTIKVASFRIGSQYYIVDYQIRFNI